MNATLQAGFARTNINPPMGIAIGGYFVPRKAERILDDLEIDYDRRQVAVGGSVIHVTQTEFNILSLLSRQVGKVMTYSAIINSIWGTMDDGSVKKLQVNMANIRRKIEKNPAEPEYLFTEVGVGYRLAESEA